MHWDAKTPQTGPKHGQTDGQRANQPNQPHQCIYTAAQAHPLDTTHSLTHSCLMKNCKSHQTHPKLTPPGEAKNHSTQDSRVVPHRGTDWAALRLTAQIGRDAVLSESYGRGYKPIPPLPLYAPPFIQIRKKRGHNRPPSPFPDSHTRCHRSAVTKPALNKRAW